MNVAEAGHRETPLLAVENYGHGRTAILATEGTWRWKMLQDHTDTTDFTFWKQQVGIWCEYMLAGSCDAEFLGIEESRLQQGFGCKETPHDFVEQQIQKYDLVRPDPMELTGKAAPACPYHMLSQL